MTPPSTQNNVNLYHQQFDITQQQTIPCPVVFPSSFTEQSTQPLLPSIQFTSTIEDTPHAEMEEAGETTKKPSNLRLVIILTVIGLGCAAYFIWHTPSTNSSTPIVSQSLPTSTNTSNSITTNAPASTIQVYITGAVQNPGVYTLSRDARVYQLLQAAGGTLPNANLVALNLAQKLVDGQEIYVSQIGETPPALGSTTNNSNNQGQLININTASATDLQQKLHLSAKSAQDIINYRQQHGPFTSIDGLLQVVSKTIYDKIKNQITV
jgi:competence protein ComEA